VGVPANSRGRELPDAGTRGRRRAAGIYGAIVTAAILAAAGDFAHTSALVVSVVVTLLVYWVAEEYAELLGEHTAHGRLPSWSQVRGAFSSTWTMVSASYLPLLTLVLAALAGASTRVAANVGLITAVLVLVFHGWLAARASQLAGWRLLAVTSIAAVLGVVMIVLKDIVLLHLH
jgi:hypothetical protein